MPLQMQLETLSLEVVKTSEIEGEILNTEQVRSSVARQLGIEHLYSNLVAPSREIDVIVEMMLKASYDYDKPLTLDELFRWHKALFPTGTSGLYNIKTGAFRDDSNGVMQVVSGGYGRTKVHFEAPKTERLPDEMVKFLAWYNDEDATLDLTIKAGLAHLWFVTLHPFDDGNGRLTRAITERMLAKSDDSKQRFYSMSAQILACRNEYYQILEHTQNGIASVNDWLIWFLSSLENSLIKSLEMLQKIMGQAKFWHAHHDTILNQRQILMINKLFGNFYSNLTSKKNGRVSPKCLTIPP
ncbi:DUF4172 domain-containing protein [Moraxella sp. FZLJ2107]|uniref:Fic family protein n=1 Tax=unclassified Moraxella TaxID=2685852 RepID=UPI0020C8F21B|nr:MULTISPECIES: DUF4172 domain-containing protein [unclassified Moraxella]UTO04545.1 DUF4172 domain-containing protein [Moraxella sp. FZLJ2107]UTO23378.1 DUF4172 domain-containing protein [Moraxella sp. FZLJ2109]